MPAVSKGTRDCSEHGAPRGAGCSPAASKQAAISTFPLNPGACSAGGEAVMWSDHSGQQFYHGTRSLPALCIATEGFWLRDAHRALGQNMLGYGIYVTAN